MQRYNRTNFTSSSVAKQIIAAMREVLLQGHSAYLANRQGKRWMRVSYHHESTQRDSLDYSQHFNFFCGSGQDVGNLIFQATFEWPHELQDEFFQVMALMARLPKHLHLVIEERDAAAKAAIERKLKDDTEARLYLLKRAGATHTAKDSLGRTIHLGFKRNWFGLGKTVTRAYYIEPRLHGGLQVVGIIVSTDAFTVGGML